MRREHGQGAWIGRVLAPASPGFCLMFWRLQAGFLIPQACLWAFGPVCGPAGLYVGLWAVYGPVGLSVGLAAPVQEARVQG